MKLILVDAQETVGVLRVAGSKAQARDLRNNIVESTGCRKKDVNIENVVEISTKKASLVDAINELLLQRDAEQ